MRQPGSGEPGAVKLPRSDGAFASNPRRICPFRSFGVRLPGGGGEDSCRSSGNPPTCPNSTPKIRLPLRREDFALAMQDVYDFFFDVNSHLHAKGIRRFDDMMRPASAPT